MSAAPTENFLHLPGIPDEQRFFSTELAARILGISRETIRRLIRDGALRVVTVHEQPHGSRDKRYMVLRTDVEQFIRAAEAQTHDPGI